MLECLGPGADEFVAAASLITACSARRGWAATSRLRLPSANRLADEAVNAYSAHEERRRCTEVEQAGYAMDAALGRMMAYLSPAPTRS